MSIKKQARFTLTFILCIRHSKTILHCLVIRCLLCGRCDVLIILWQGLWQEDDGLTGSDGLCGKKIIARCTFLNETMLSDVCQREFQLYYTRLQTQHPGGCFYCIYWSFQQNLSVKLQLRSCRDRKPLVNMNAVWNGCYSTSRNENLNIIFFFLWKWLRGINFPLFFMKIQNLKKKQKEKKKFKFPCVVVPFYQGYWSINQSIKRTLFI